MLLDIVKVYDGVVIYHLGKMNVVVDVLRGKLNDEPLWGLCLQ